MTKNVKIMLGLGVVATVGAYFYFNNKKEKETKSEVGGVRLQGKGGGVTKKCYKFVNGVAQVTTC